MLELLHLVVGDRGAYHALKQRKYDRRKSLFGTRGTIWAKPLGASIAVTACAKLVP